MRTGMLMMIAAASLCAAMKPDEFSFHRQLSAPDSQSGEIAVFRFDGLLYRGTDRSFSDLRLFDEQSHEVPFLVRTVTADTTVIVGYGVELKQLSFQQLPGNRMEIVFMRDKDDSIPTELSINTPIVNFENTVSVHGSTDKKEWRPLVEKSPIYDYSRLISMRNTTVRFEKEPHVWYKVTVNKVTNPNRSMFSRIVTETVKATERKRYIDFIEAQEPFRIDGISFSGNCKEVQYGKPQTQKYALKIEQVREDSAVKTTELYLLSPREPLREVSLSTCSINFTRRVQIEATDDSTENASWRTLGSCEVYNISIDNHQRKQLTVSLGGIDRFTRYRLKIFNGDNAPIKVDSVSALGELHEGLFFHRGMRKVSICYGSDKAETPLYDINEILRNAPVLTGEVWRFGEQVGAGKPAARFNTKYLLIGALILMVLVLVGALVVTVRKVDEKTGEGGGNGGVE